MHACASLTDFPVFAVEQPRERKRINRSRSQSSIECCAVKVDFALIYAAFREYKALRRYLLKNNVLLCNSAWKKAKSRLPFE